MTDFAVITALLEDTIKPSGPYFIVLWTQYPDQAPGLRNYLDERLGSGVTKPFEVCPLSKSDHIDGDGKIRDQRKLMGAIRNIIQKSPQVAAVVEWESRVLEAAGRTVSSVLDLASREDTEQRANKLGKILGWLAVEAVVEIMWTVVVSGQSTMHCCRSWLTESPERPRIRPTSSFGERR